MYGIIMKFIILLMSDNSNTKYSFKNRIFGVGHILGICLTFK
jgi:hypothetical protein